MPPPAIDVPLSYRFLPAEEWHRLAAIEPFRTCGLPDPDGWSVLVVERGDQIVGSCSLFTAMHWDCWWIDPRERGATRGVILRQLLREALASFHNAGIEQVYTGAEDAQPEVADLLTRFGFAPVAGQLFMLTVADAAVAFGTR